MFEVNQSTGKVPDQLSLNTSDSLLSCQLQNDLCIVFVREVLASRAVNLAVVKFDCFLHDPDTLNFGVEQSNKFQNFFRHEGGKA